MGISDIVIGIVSMDKNNQHRNRKIVKIILSKLIRKYSFEAVEKYVPENLAKLIANIRKTQARAKRLKNSTDSESDESDNEDITKNKPESFEELIEDSDSDIEEENSGKKKKNGKSVKSTKKVGASWIKETHGDNIVDFLDQSVNRNVLASKPLTYKKDKKEEHGFKLAADGRFIITGD